MKERIQNKVILSEKMSQIQDYWSPKICATLNDYEFKLARLNGEFVWHKHNDTDEAFLVLKGRLNIEFRDGCIELNAGELYVVPKGVEHKPWAADEVEVLLIEPKGVINTGDAQTSHLTASEKDWV